MKLFNKSKSPDERVRIAPSIDLLQWYIFALEQKYPGQENFFVNLKIACDAFFLAWKNIHQFTLEDICAVVKKWYMELKPVDELYVYTQQAKDILHTFEVLWTNINPEWWSNENFFNAEWTSKISQETEKIKKVNDYFASCASANCFSSDLVALWTAESQNEFNRQIQTLYQNYATHLIDNICNELVSVSFQDQKKVDKVATNLVTVLV